MKHILLEIINNDASYNKSVTRYLYKTHPKLWQQILNQTIFLPGNAKAKQRIWHILNDVFTIPICPETGKLVKWHENRYLTFVSNSAKASYQNKLGIYNNRSTETNEKRRQTVKENYRNGKHIEVGDRNIDRTNHATKIKKTCLEKYGVDNVSKLPEIQEKIYQRSVERGCTPREDRSARQLYYETVLKITKSSWLEHFDKINPTKLDRSEYTLDHIYSVQQGFRDNIPPDIIGHWTNLRIMTRSKNSQKGMTCDKTKEQLFEDFLQDK